MGLPKVYVIGDSISCQYGPYLRDLLAGVFGYARKTGDEPALRASGTDQSENGGDSSAVLVFLEAMQTHGGIDADLLLVTNECRIGWAPSLSSAFTRKPGRRFSVVFGHAHRRCARKHGYARHRTLPAVNRLERLPAEAGTLAGMG